MMRRWSLSAVLALGLGIAACGGVDVVGRSIAQRRGAADVMCRCPASVGASTEAECRARMMTMWATDREEACVRRVYDAHRAELAPVFDCQYHASVAVTDCMGAALETCPPAIGTLSGCADAFRAANEACPSASAPTDAALRACFAPRT